MQEWRRESTEDDLVVACPGCWRPPPRAAATGHVPELLLLPPAASHHFDLLLPPTSQQAETATFLGTPGSYTTSFSLAFTRESLQGRASDGSEHTSLQHRSNRRGMFNKGTIAKMKKGMISVNNTRGAIMETQAVVKLAKLVNVAGDLRLERRANWHESQRQYKDSDSSWSKLHQLELAAKYQRSYGLDSC